MSLSTTGEMKKRKSRGKGKRVTCAICLKPAVAYYNQKSGGSVRVTFEHRDEPPISTFTYRGQIYRRYRRCHGGTVMAHGLPDRDSDITEEQQEQPSTDTTYEKRYNHLIEELHNIVYDIDGETAMRMIKNIRRMLGTTTGAEVQKK